MNTTIIELEFVELPITPDDARETGLSFAQPLESSFRCLLSMWDRSARVAWWNGDFGSFEDGGGLLNEGAIRSWAPLPAPLDHPAWGSDMAEAAKNYDKAEPEAGWLKPTYWLPNGA